MAFSSTVHILCTLTSTSLRYLLQLTWQKILAARHRRAYKATADPKNVVVIGASFAGLQVAQRLTETLPTGYRVVLVEKNECLNWVFAFPRFSVMGGYEEGAFVPYGKIQKNAAAGIFEHRRATVVNVEIDDDGWTKVLLETGELLQAVCVVIATGCTQKVPARLLSTGKDGACAELRVIQGKIKGAGSVAVVGGGAVGVQLATDVKDTYPDKDVTLVHSREKILPNFGPRLQHHAQNAMKELGVTMMLGERPTMTVTDGAQHVGPGALEWSNGTRQEFDLIIPCTGQVPNSQIIQHQMPECISKAAGHIRVNGHLQICDHAGHVSNPSVFALGDVADTGGPRMARASMFQGDVVVQNVLALVKGNKPRARYHPNWALEGNIKLTLGVHNLALYAQTGDGREMLFTSKRGPEDLGIKTAWIWHAADSKQFPARQSSQHDEIVHAEAGLTYEQW